MLRRREHATEAAWAATTYCFACEPVMRSVQGSLGLNQLRRVCVLRIGRRRCLIRRMPRFDVGAVISDSVPSSSHREECIW